MSRKVRLRNWSHRHSILMFGMLACSTWKFWMSKISSPKKTSQCRYKKLQAFPRQVFDVSFLWPTTLQSSFISDSQVYCLQPSFFCSDFKNSTHQLQMSISSPQELQVFVYTPSTSYQSENTKVSTLPCWSPREITFCWASMLAPLVLLQWRPFLLEPPRWLGWMELWWSYPPGFTLYHFYFIICLSWFCSGV